jgi:phage host-nuclease inhibitor protein Gam
MNKLKVFFWLCSGANHAILKKCPTESSKYVGIGATVFFTGVFAAIAASYAMYTVFDNYLTAIAFGIVWGLMIFNLDRFIVSSMRKNGKVKKEFLMSIPRIVLAILISLVIAKPLELKIFEKEILVEHQLLEQQQINIKKQQITAGFQSQQNELNSEIDGLKNEIAEKTKNRDELRRIAQEEADGTGGSMRRNAGPIYQIKKADADRVEEELRQLTASNNQLISQKQERLSEIDSLVQSEVNALEKNRIPGPAARLEALSSLTSRSQAIWLSNWFILLLFVAVEIAPVLVKLIAGRGPYDRLLQMHEREFETSMYQSFAADNKRVREQTTDYPEIEKIYVEEKLKTSLSKT